MSRIDQLAQALQARPPVLADPTGRARAAVAIVLAPHPDAILLIRRAERAGDRWSGQMAFPGGRWAAEDPDLLTTAKRETSEEVGLDLTRARVLGQFDDSAPRSPSLPPVVVTPYLFAVDRAEPLNPNLEVAAAGWVPSTSCCGARCTARSSIGPKVPGTSSLATISTSVLSGA